MEEFYVVKEEHILYHLLRAPSFLFLFLWSPPPPQGGGPSIPHLSVLPYSNPDDCSSAFKTQCGLKAESCPWLCPFPIRPGPGQARSVPFCWLHTAHTTIPIPTWDHVIYICLLFPKRKWTPQGPGPNLYVPAWSTGSGRMFFPIIPPFQKIYASEPQEMRIHAEPVVSHSAL